MKKLLFVTLSLCFVQLIKAATTDQNVNITVDNETRNYQLYVPNNIQSNCPLVISLHGANGHSTDRSPFVTGVADNAGCIVAYPQGKQTAFPIGFGGSTTGWTATGEDNFDAKFLKAVIEDVASKYSIDRKRIYCCGFSNGGMMTYAMSNACSDVFAAFASISGYPINEFHLRHTGKRPVPFLHIHGKNDNFVLYEKVPTIVDEMVARLGANPVPVKTSVSNKYTKSVYSAGDGSFPYIFYEIDGMGHEAYTSNTEDGNSAQTMWNFFSQYTLDSSCDQTLKWRPRIETNGYVPTAHGWTMNSGTTLLEFGGDQYTTTNKNVYHSLQFDSGKYKLCFKSAGEAGKTITVKIQKLTSPNTVVLNTTVNVGENAELTFEISDGWGEYKLTLTRPTASDNISVTDITVYQTGEANITSASVSINSDLTETIDSHPNNFVEIQQGNSATGFTATGKEVKSEYTEYTSTGDVQLAFKMENIDVTGCDYIIIDFYEPVASGWNIAFWGISGPDGVKAIPAGTQTLNFKLTEKLGDTEATYEQDGKTILKEITMLDLWGATHPLVAKVKGIYKHKASDGSRTYSFDSALDFTDVEGLKAYTITSFDPAKATLTLNRVYQVPASTGLYLVGKGGDYQVPVIENAAAIGTNMLHASSGTDALNPTEGSYTNLIFGGTGADRGFHPLSTAGIIGANKAYLQLPTAQFTSIPSGARLSLVIEDETSAVNTLSDIKATDSAWYTISGLKMNAKPANKGIYIYNGRKYAIQ